MIIVLVNGKIQLYFNDCQTSARVLTQYSVHVLHTHVGI